MFVFLEAHKKCLKSPCKNPEITLPNNLLGEKQLVWKLSATAASKTNRKSKMRANK